MSQPTPLNPTEQDALIRQIGLALLQAAPEDWHQVRAEYRAAGRYFELSAEITSTDGRKRTWTAPQETATSFARLRAGMYRDGRGTWFNATYQLDRPTSYNLDFDRDEPRWQSPPPPQAYLDELRFFPRTEDNVPEWLTGFLAQPQAQPQQAQPQPPSQQSNPAIGGAPRFRTARIFDGPGPDGRPSVNRPEVDPSEVDKILAYLQEAPVALTSLNVDTDRLAGDNPETIPIAFHTDGTWIWPAAVPFYLARYRISPEIELVQHIRSRDFQLSEVDEQTRVAAATQLGAMVPGGQLAPAPAPIMHPPVAPMVTPAAADTTLIVMPVHQPVLDAEQTSYVSELIPTLHNSELTDTLQRVISELGIPAEAYRIGEPTPNTWCLERVNDGWQVGWYEPGFSTPMLFDDEHDAAAFLLGKLLLTDKPSTDVLVESNDVADVPSAAVDDHGAMASNDVQSIPIPIPVLSAATVTVARNFQAPPLEQQHIPASDVASIPPIIAAQPAATHRKPETQRVEDWPIQPLRGEPPLTLFRGKHLIELPAGIELDRFGQPDGNLSYAGGTPFPRRSLVPEWVNRPYHVYRLQRPTQALTGIAVPWFGQPGGGTAYVLPRSIEDLLADGTLIEVDHDREPPING